MAAKSNKKQQAEKVGTPEQQFAAARQQLADFQQVLFGLCITPDPVGADGKPIVDPETGKTQKAKEPTDTAGKVKATVMTLNQTYKDTLKDATGAAVPKTPVNAVTTEITSMRKTLARIHGEVGKCLTLITDAQQSYNEQLQVANGSITKKRAQRAAQERLKIERANQKLQELGETA